MLFKFAIAIQKPRVPRIFVHIDKRFSLGDISNGLFPNHILEGIHDFPLSAVLSERGLDLAHLIV